MEEKPKRGIRSEFHPDNFPCPICGQKLFAWGLTVGESPSQRLYYRDRSAGWGGGEVMDARKCLSCGNVQLFARW